MSGPVRPAVLTQQERRRGVPCRRSPWASGSSGVGQEEASCRLGRSLRWSPPARSCCSCSCWPSRCLKLGRTLDEATIAIRKAHEGSAPLFDDAQTTLPQVNTQLERVDGITAERPHGQRQRLGAHLAVHRDARRPARAAAALSYGLSKAVKARREGKDAGAHARRRGAPGASPVKRLFWLGVGLAAGAYRPAGPARPRRTSRPPGSAPTWPTACASSVPGSARSVPRSAPGCRPASRS